MVQLIVMLVVAMAAPALAGQTAGGVTGMVVAAETGQPVADARVALDGTTITAVTDAAGAFSLTGVPPGRHALVASREGFETVRAEVVVTAGSAATLEIRLPFRLDLREDVAVVGRTVGALGLDTASPTGSRLNLPALDIPAAIDVLDSTVMDARGYQRVSDAVSSMAGVVSGEHPTAPSSFVIRGFTASQVSILRDGIWLGPSTMVMRPQNTFNLERIELLRGPASVINGQGAVAGTINAVIKSAEPIAATTGQALLSYGRFGTYHAAAGAAGPLADTVWYRADASRSGSDGYVDRMDSGSTNLTGSLLWRPHLRARIRFSADYLDDDLGKYFGTPLVPRAAAATPLDVIQASTGETIDARTRFVNYNVADSHARARQVLLRSDVSIDLGRRVTLQNVAYGFDAERSWKNAEGYVYCTAVVDVCRAVGQIQRYYGYFIIDHDQRLYGNRLTLNIDAPLAEREHRVVAGLETSTLDFTRTRGFRIQAPQTSADGVDLLRPVPGEYGPEEVRGISPTAIATWGAFVENSLAVTSRLRLAGALRYDGLDLDRRNLTATGAPAAGGFTRTFNWWSWRAGAVATLAPGVVGYGQYSNAKDPVSANLFLVNSGQNFDLTEARQWEIGMKADRGRGQFTLTYFDIERDDVLERFALDSATNLGGVAARGVEATGVVTAGGLRVGANAAHTRSAFRPSPNFVRLAGNRAANVPRVTANLWASYEGVGGLPLEIGGGLRQVGDRFANNTNTITMNGYVLADLYAAWTRGRLRITARVDNLTDRAYASWADVFYLGQNDPSFLYANQLMLGAPRTFSVMVQTRF
jgi:iron complex outermembrane recepter protein